MADDIPDSPTDVTASVDRERDETPPATEAVKAPTVDALQLDPDDPIQRFLDIPIRVSVQLDRRRARVREVLDLRPDAVLQLDRSAGENVDLLVNGLRVGSGEIVVIEDAMGLRITDLVRDERRGRK